MIKTAEIYNTYVGMRYSARIDFSSGGVIYRANPKIPLGTPLPLYKLIPDYECFFLVRKEKARHFASVLGMVNGWEPSYDNGTVIDGYRWSIDINGGEVKTYGVNGKPVEFDYLMSELETMLEKDFTGRAVYSR